MQMTAAVVTPHVTNGPEGSVLEDFSESGCLDVDAHLSSVRTSVTLSQFVCSDADSQNPVLCLHLHVDVCE